MSMTQQQAHGKMGEDAAAAHYENEGYRIVARNYRVSHKEIDLIVENDESLVFVEVKSRIQAYGARSRYGRPADAVDVNKRRLTVNAAQAYLRTHSTNKSPRIDVVEVYLTRKDEKHLAVERVVCFRNAFGAR